jgi:hypothetical protein
VPNEQALTPTQWVWLQCQLLLDEGIHICPACEALGRGLYCTACGVRQQPVPRTCEQCQVPGTGAYCAQCGAMVRSPVEEAIDAETFDWDAWARSLRPFLHGLTPQEQQVLRRG